MGYQLLCIGCVAAVIYLAIRTIYRLYLHPLSKFPGPRLTAITHLYEFYYDAVKGGKFMWEVERMHEQYGPIVRINPRELHIKDPHFFDRIYTSKRQEKDKYMVRIFASPLSAAATVDHDLHRMRRELVNPFFSKRSVMALEHLVQDKIEKAASRLEQAHKDGTVVSVDGLFAALTADVISHYTFGETMRILDTNDLRNDFREAVVGAGEMCHLGRFFGFFQSILEYAPDLIERVQPSAKGLFDSKRMLANRAEATMKGDFGESAGGMRTIFDSLLDKSVPESERAIARVRDEAMTVLAAGTETTARVLAVGTFHLYRDREMMIWLREEVRQVMPEPTSSVPLSQLEKLPYLTAVINESLRMSHSVSIRLPRVAPTPIEYKDYTIPPGTPVSQILYFMHTDPSIFPDPHTFNPSRWINASDKGERLTKFLVPFTKGPRICVGMNLAFSELYQMFAVLVRRFDLEIYKTTPESIRITRDLMIGLPDSDALRVNALVSGVVRD
ncbi:hypothetical protein ASPWEDRAFT_180261 [Aspergillus wentii DTO 134E9]|uniref:Cytochrome P450 n=1 Tax=Aspergillus wentii DTO 134E9 TaxID=1073089 RepID=A0A1L9RV80_ASPWE|nr:uncharacterized protein ASPWEDRAFT_180261 [Aspergillus wentii DTO 134E9]KAI9928681.1 hypothetical protein MW887_001897 [Aspergillus wentii]OJJ38768.1 hypothetical protein ASPWEDRAFT_180261 [Aspergillus wentii DTO 134E9]